jgi:antitoxin ParD1/3/4
MNHLIRQARAEQERMEIIRSRLISAEQGGFVPPDREAILAEFKDTLRNDG